MQRFELLYKSPEGAIEKEAELKYDNAAEPEKFRRAKVWFKDLSGQTDLTDEELLFHGK